MKRKAVKNLFHEPDYILFKAVLDQCKEGFSLLDHTGQFVGVNKTFCEFSGYTESEILAKNVLDMFSPDVLNKPFVQLVEESFGGQDLKILPRGGELLDVKINGSPIKCGGKIYYLLGMGSNLASHREAENILKINEKKYRTLFDAAPDPIVIHDGKRILDLNQATLTALALTSKEQMIGRDPFALLHPDDKKPARARLAQLVKDGKPLQPAEFRMIVKNNEQRTVLASPTPIEFGGQQAFMVNYHDITDRKAITKELIRSKEFAENLMETANTMVVAFDTDARVTTFNKYAEDLTGYKKAEVIGKNWFKLFIPQRDHSTIPLLFTDVLQQMPESSHNENHIRLKNGEERLIRWSNNIMLTSTGAAQGVLSIGIDITESKRAEEALRISEENFRNVVQDQTEYIMRYLPDGSITFVNESYCRAFNTSPEKAVGNNITRGNLDTEIERIARKIEALSKDNPIITDEHVSIAPDGEQVWHLWIDRGIFDEYGVLKEIQAVGRDITDRKKMEASLQTSSKQLEEAQRMANMGSYLIDMSTNIWTNSKTLDDIFGIDETYVRDTEGWLDLIHPHDRTEVYNYYQSCLQEKRKKYDKEYRIIRKNDQSQRWIHGMAEFEYDQYKNPLTMKGVIQDITDRKLAEEERERALSDARTANLVKNKFIANISHEIRTPLNSILGFSDILNQRNKEFLSKDDKNIFDYINNASKRLIRTVDSILNISQLEAGTIKIYPQTIDLVAIAKLVIRESRQVAEEKGLKIQLSSIFEEANVYADEYCIVQAITNLIENAIKFTQAGTIEIEITRRDDRLALAVIDSGIGISEDYQERIYEPYTQESEGFTKLFQGVGLGMALTKRYVDLNDVEIKFKSEGGVGTTFILIFPPYEGAANA